MNNRRRRTAEGVRDIYGAELREKKEIMNAVREVFRGAGYEGIETPMFEYFDVFSSEIGTTPSRDLFKFFDREGDTLVLRPDFTPGVARAVSAYFTDVPRPLRLCYEGDTFVNSSEMRGLLKENTQMGIELIGEDSAEADAEVIRTVCRSLTEAGLSRFQIGVGEVNFFKSLAAEAELTEEETEQIRREINRKNFFGVEEAVTEMKMPETVKKAMTELPQLFGDVSVLDHAASLAVDSAMRSAIGRLREIYSILSAEGLEKYISFDFGYLSKYRYYTGIIFTAYTYGVGEPIAKGGRYDDLLGFFGAPEPAVGAGITIGTLALAQRGRNS